MLESQAEDAKGKVGRSLREVLLIVMGVLIALALESLWQDRQDRIVESEMLAGLLAELEENQEKVAQSLQVHEKIGAAAGLMLDALGSVSWGQEVHVPDSILSQVVRGPTYQPIRARLDAALSSGRIGLIRSSDVQRALAAWARLAAEALEEERDGREFVSSQLLPVLREATDLEVVYRTYVESANRTEFGTLLWGTTTSSVTTSRGLVNLIGRRRFYTATAAGSLGSLREHLDQTVALIEAEGS